MNSERISLEQMVSTGIDAQNLLNNKLLSSLIYSKKNAACEAFMSTNINDDQGRKKLWHDAQAVITFERELQQLVEAGNIAKTQLDFLDNMETPNYNPIAKG